MILGGKESALISKPPITVVVAGRKNGRRAALLRFLEPEQGIQVVAEVSSGFEVIRTLAQLKPRILLMGFNLLEGGKIDLLSLVREKTPRTKVILLTSRTLELQILEALSRGARGYLAAGDVGAFLIKALRLVDAGQAWVPRKMVARLVDRLARLTAESKKIKRG